MEIILDDPGGPRVITMIFIRGRQEVREERRCHTTGFEDEGRGHKSKNGGRL